MKNLLFILLFIASLTSCEWLGEQDTPLCKDCYKAHYNSNNELIEKTEESNLCGGDVIVWESFDDEEVNGETIKYECN